MVIISSDGETTIARYFQGAMKELGFSPKYLAMGAKQLEKIGLTPIEVFEKFNRIALLEVDV